MSHFKKNLLIVYRVVFWIQIWALSKIWYFTSHMVLDSFVSVDADIQRFKMKEKHILGVFSQEIIFFKSKPKEVAIPSSLG